jgi:hypothetical protein
MSNRHAPIARYRIHRSDGNGVGESLYTDDPATAAEAAEGVGVVVVELLVDKAAIVAELERLTAALKSVASESKDPLSKSLAIGMSLGMKDAIRVAQAGGALPLESEEKVEGN